MADLKLAQFEHNSQLLIDRFKKVNRLLGRAWIELELLHLDAKELSKSYGEWMVAKGLCNGPNKMRGARSSSTDLLK